MPRKKIKLITLDLDDTVWPNHKVILDAENLMDVCKKKLLVWMRKLVKRVLTK